MDLSLRSSPFIIPRWAVDVLSVPASRGLSLAASTHRKYDGSCAWGDSFGQEEG